MCTILGENNRDRSKSLEGKSESHFGKSEKGKRKESSKSDSITFNMIPTLNENEKTAQLICPSEPRSPFKTIFKRGTDMKFRLGFLKRRHPEGTNQGASVRPQPAGAQVWANSFNDLMTSKYGQSLFKAFLQREFSDENLEFWLAVEDYRKCRPNKINTKAQKIYNDFIVPQAPKEVNLDSITREGLISKMSNSTHIPTETTFDQAQKRIQGLLEADAYVRFLQSDLYLELVHPEKYES